MRSPPPPPPPPRRLILKVLPPLLLLLAWGAAGAAVNIAVAWGLAYGWTLEEASETAFQAQGFSAGEATHEETCVMSGLGWRPADWWGDDPRGIVVQRFAQRGREFTRWYETTRPTGPRTKFNRFVPFRHCAVRLDSGWPFYSMRGYIWNFGGQSGTKWQPSQALAINLDPYLEVVAFIPIQPTPGFAVNTLFYAAVLWMLFAGPSALRRTIRRRRGQCPACAYPVGTWGGERCTECGKPLP